MPVKFQRILCACVGAEEFLDWVDNIECYFDYKDVPEESKIGECKTRGPTSVWWKHYLKECENRGKGKFRTWEKMKEKLRAQFLPRDYNQTLY